MAAHRAAVLEFNEDVVGPEALAESARRRGLEITVEIENLKIAEQPNGPRSSLRCRSLRSGVRNAFSVRWQSTLRMPDTGS